jgi:hypothetical protein
MIRVCQTREDRLANLKYFEKVRNITAKMRDDYDRVRENKFHNNFYKNVRPEFMEPLPKKFKKK